MSKPSTSSNPLPALSSLADPPQKYIDACAMDYFLIEAVHTLRASSLVASTRAKKIEKEMIDAGLIPPPAAPGATAKDLNRVRGSAGASRESLGSAGPTSGSTITNAGKGDEEEEGLRVRLEAIGIHVGSNFAERFVPSPQISKSILYSLLLASTDYAETNLSSQILLMLSNLSVKTSG